MMANVHQPHPPRGFVPPLVRKKENGVAAFRAYDWHFHWMQEHLRRTRKVFLTPCAATKPIHASPLHRSIYQKFAAAYGRGREVLVVSEPAVLIRYRDLYDLEDFFLYDFPPRLLGYGSRVLFVDRLHALLTGKDIAGCLPRHHASLIHDAVGNGWENFWSGDLYSMMRRAGALVSDR